MIAYTNAFFPLLLLHMLVLIIVIGMLHKLTVDLQ